MSRIKHAYRGGDEEQRPGWWFSFEFNQALIDRLKAVIPYQHRRYSETAREWWVHEEWVPELLRVLPELEAWTAQAPLF